MLKLFSILSILISFFPQIASTQTFPQSICRTFDYCDRCRDSADEKKCKTELPIVSSCKDLKDEYKDAEKSRWGNFSGNCGLSKTHQTLIHWYSRSGYSCFNEYLRGKKQGDKDMETTISELNHALSGLPSYVGFVWRFTYLTPELRKLHTKGSIVEYDGFTSTTTRNAYWWAEVPYKNSQMKYADQFLIYSRSGKPIMGLAFHLDEREVLFKAGTKFKVLDTFTEGNKNFYIMRELFPLSDKKLENEQDLENQMDEVVLKLYLKNKHKSGKSADEWVCDYRNKAPSERYILQKRFPGR